MPPLSMSSLWSGMKSMTLCVLQLVELAGVGVGDAADVARKLDDGDLHAQADAEIGDVVRRGQ